MEKVKSKKLFVKHNDIIEIKHVKKEISKKFKYWFFPANTLICGFCLEEGETLEYGFGDKYETL